jgi:hypothetical protein
MPGHMNVLLAEANVPYDEVFELEDINGEFAQADVAFIIGANDVVNPAARPTRAARSMACPCSTWTRPRPMMNPALDERVGYSGVDNDVFYMDQTMMLLADAKRWWRRSSNPPALRFEGIERIMRGLAIAVLGASLVLGGCVQGIARGRVQARGRGLSQPMAECMAQRMVDHLTISQLRKLEALQGPKRSAMDYVAAVQRINDPQVIQVTASAAGACVAQVGPSAWGACCNRGGELGPRHG